MIAQDDWWLLGVETRAEHRCLISVLQNTSQNQKNRKRYDDLFAATKRERLEDWTAEDARRASAQETTQQILRKRYDRYDSGVPRDRAFDPPTEFVADPSWSVITLRNAPKMGDLPRFSKARESLVPLVADWNQAVHGTSLRRVFSTLMDGMDDSLGEELGWGYSDRKNRAKMQTDQWRVPSRFSVAGGVAFKATPLESLEVGSYWRYEGRNPLFDMAPTIRRRKTMATRESLSLSENVPAVMEQEPRRTVFPEPAWVEEATPPDDTVCTMCAAARPAGEYVTPTSPWDGTAGNFVDPPKTKDETATDKQALDLRGLCSYHVADGLRMAKIQKLSPWA